MPIRVLVIDDDLSLRVMVKEGLPETEFLVQGAADAGQGLAMIERSMPDVALLDWNLPDKSGLDVCRILRKGERTARLPIIMLTALEKTSNKVAALDIGADDYLTKPFELKELAARIKAVLRRLAAGTTPPSLMTRGCLEIDGPAYRASVSGLPLELSATEFRILQLLAAHEDHPLTREVILEHVCAQTTETLRTVDVHIHNLRQKLGEAGEYIKTVHQIGYVFTMK